MPSAFVPFGVARWGDLQQTKWGIFNQSITLYSL